MIIHYFNVVRVASLPFKADTPLIVNPNTVLPQAVPGQFFQAIGRGDTQVFQSHSPMQHTQFAQRYLLYIGGQLVGTLAVEQLFGFFGLERPDHQEII